MVRDQGPLKPANPWPRIAWWFTAGVLVIPLLLAFLLLGRAQQNGPPLGAWAAFCHALGISPDTGPTSEPQPPLVTPTRIVWTNATFAAIAGGQVTRGAFVAANCTACHGEEGVSRTALFPTLAGMEATTIYKQLDDFRDGKRQSGVMNAIATALGAPQSADVAAYFASRTNGLAVTSGEPFPSADALRGSDPAARLIFVGDPARGIPPCSACHGPAGNVIGAPSLRGQQPSYIVAQLTAFAQGSRQNDINEQMRAVASQLAPDEMNAIGAYYGAGPGAPRRADAADAATAASAPSRAQ